jgi:hypothetical protein
LKVIGGAWVMPEVTTVRISSYLTTPFLSFRTQASLSVAPASTVHLMVYTRNGVDVTTVAAAVSQMMGLPVITLLIDSSFQQLRPSSLSPSPL